MKNIIYIITILFLLWSCAGSKNAKTADPRYQRKPIVEVSEADLKTEAAQLEATTLMEIGKQHEAIDRFQAILKNTPNYAPAHYELGKIYLGMGWVDSALTHTLQAVHTSPSNYWYEHQLAKIYEKKHDAKNLISTWETIVKQHPDNPNHYYDLSNAYIVTNNIPAAIEALDRVEKKFGISEPVSLQKQKLWSAIDKPEKARKELEKLAEAVPSEPSYSAILAESYMAEKNYTKALQYYNRILTNTPDDENIHISIASCYLTMGQYDMAFHHLRESVLNPNIDCQHRLLFVTEFLRNRSFFAAYSKPCFLLADTIVNSCNENSSHLFLYGQILAAQERYADAAVQFAKHIENDKSQYEAWEALLICESMVSDTSAQLLDHAKQASELFPLHLRPYLILAQGYHKLGDCEKAREYINRCMMVAPNDNLTKQLYQNINQSCQ